MAAWAVALSFYGAWFQSVVETTPSFTNFFKLGGVRRQDITAAMSATSSGPVGGLQCVIPTAVTLQSLTDGTMLANNAARTVVALTPFIKAHTVSLDDTMLGGYTDQDDEGQFVAFADAARKFAELEVVTDLVAATPGLSVNLPTGQIDFASDGTLAQNYLAINALDKAIAYVESKTQGKLAGADGSAMICIVTTYQGWGNLKTLANYNGYGGQARIKKVGGQLYFDDYPVFQFNQSLSGWQGASDVAAFVCHADCEALYFEDATWPDQLKEYGDGYFKKIGKCFGAAGFLQTTHCAEVVNPAS